MENAGAVTFTEYYIFRDPPTENERARRADTLLYGFLSKKNLL
jgi:aminopeptidase N